MIVLEILAVILTLVSIYLTIKNNIHCWWTGIFSNLLYFFLFMGKHIWADMSLQWIFIAQGAWAWWMWSKPKETLQILKSTTFENIKSGLMTFVIWVALMPILSYLKGNNPPLDAINTTFSILGIYLLGKHRVEAWYFWILTDIISIFLYWRTGLFITCGLYVVCLGLAISGLIEWRKLYQKNLLSKLV